MNFIEIQNLGKNFGSNEVFNDINLSIKRGEFIVLLGPSGCGKSTLLNCMAGLIKFERGDIFIDSQNMNQVHPSQRNIAMVFQSYALYPNMTVQNNISFGMKIRKKSKSEIEEKIQQVSKILNISELLKRKPAQLSGGQQQRVAIGRALVRNPQLFLFDEPLSNLDAKLRMKMRTEIKRLHKQLQTTMIYVTHDQIEAMTLADRIAVMNQGEVVQYGSPKEIYFEPNHVFVAEFIGSPPMNLIPAVLMKVNRKLVFEVQGSKPYLFPVPSRAEALKKSKGRTKPIKHPLEHYLNQEILVGVRSENIHLGKEASTKFKKGRLDLKVDFIEPNGADNLIICDFNGKEIICRIHSDHPLPEPKYQKFYLDLDKVLFYDRLTGSRVY